MARVGELFPNSDQSENDDEQEERIETQNKRKSLQPEVEKDEVKYNIKFTVPMRKKLRNDHDPEEEARLERLVFGDHADVLNNLLQDDDDNDDTESKLHSTAHLPLDTNTSKADTHDTYHSGNKNGVDDSTNNSDPEDEVEETVSDSGVEEEDMKNRRKPAWIDDDDAENCSVQKALHLQHRKLPVPAAEDTYKELLINKYQQLVGTPKWAEFDKKKDGSEEESEDEVLRHSSHLITPKVKNLAPGTIELKTLKKINHETRTEGPVVTNVQFHPTCTVALVAGLSGILSTFHIDGKTNPKLHSMQYHSFPINTARFTKEGTEIVVGSGRHSFCHAYDLLAGKTHRIPLPHRMTNMKTFELSPDEKMIAACGRYGLIYVLSSKTKELMYTMQMNDQCHALAFSPDSTKLFTHGEGGEMYVWDLRERTCMHRAIDDGCFSASTITVSPSGQYLATGSRLGVVNVYDMGTVLERKRPTPIKIVLNLVTSITSLRFNPTSEILSMASDETDNAFRMMHLPSATIYSNFPSFNTRLNNPIAIDFSPSSGYLGITNNRGSAYLYRLKHYGNY